MPKPWLFASKKKKKAGWLVDKLALGCQRPLRSYICGTDSKDKREIFLLPGAHSVSKAWLLPAGPSNFWGIECRQQVRGWRSSPSLIPFLCGRKTEAGRGRVYSTQMDFKENSLKTPQTQILLMQFLFLDPVCWLVVYSFNLLSDYS